MRERLAVTWIAPDGTLWPLTTPPTGVKTLAATNHGAAAPILLTTDSNPRGGVVLRHTQPQARTLIWPVQVRGATHMQFITRWRALGDAFTQTEDFGPGTLRITRPDGSSREIRALYESGWEGEPRFGWLWDNAVLSLLCEDPYWRAVAPVTITREHSDPADFYDPYASISSGQVLGETTVTNPGEVRAWPVWRLTGPLAGFTATNNDTGEAFSFDPTWDGGPALAVGETATIITDPVQIRGPNDEVWTGAINFPAGVLWPLRRGDNDLTFAAAGAAVGTKVQLEFHPRFRTA